MLSRKHSFCVNLDFIHVNIFPIRRPVLDFLGAIIYYNNGGDGQEGSVKCKLSPIISPPETEILPKLNEL